MGAGRRRVVHRAPQRQRHRHLRPARREGREYSAQHDPGLSYTLYLLTFALDSVADVFGSLFMLGTGLLVLRSRPLPRWLGWVAILTGPFFFLQGFGLGGVVSTIGLTLDLDLIGFLLFLVFVLVSSVMMLARRPVGSTP
jgi:hypothetical protein